MGYLVSPEEILFRLQVIGSFASFIYFGILLNRAGPIEGQKLFCREFMHCDPDLCRVRVVHGLGFG